MSRKRMSKLLERLIWHAKKLFRDFALEKLSSSPWQRTGRWDTYLRVCYGLICSGLRDCLRSWVLRAHSKWKVVGLSDHLLLLLGYRSAWSLGGVVILLLSEILIIIGPCLRLLCLCDCIIALTELELKRWLQCWLVLVLRLLNCLNVIDANDLVDWQLLQNWPLIVTRLNPFVPSVSGVQMFVLLKPKMVQLCPSVFMRLLQEFCRSLKDVFLKWLVLLLLLSEILEWWLASP